MVKIVLSELNQFNKKEQLLEDVSVDFQPGTVAAIAALGPEEATAIFDTLTGAEKYDGVAQIDDLNAYKDRKQLREQVVELDETTKIGTKGSVSENLFASLKKADTGLSQEQIQGILRQLDLHENDLVSSLEPGALQQFKLIKLITQGAKVLLLRNPTAEMSDIQRIKIWQLLRDFAVKTGAIILFTTQSVAEMQSYADEILYFSNGKLRNVRALATHDTTDSIVTVRGTGFPVAVAETLGSYIIREASDEVQLLFSGNIQALLPLLEQSTITDVRIQDATIEDELTRF